MILKKNYYHGHGVWSYFRGSFFPQEWLIASRKLCPKANEKLKFPILINSQLFVRLIIAFA